MPDPGKKRRPGVSVNLANTPPRPTRPSPSFAFDQSGWLACEVERIGAKLLEVQTYTSAVCDGTTVSLTVSVEWAVALTPVNVNPPVGKLPQSIPYERREATLEHTFTVSRAYLFGTGQSTRLAFERAILEGLQGLRHRIEDVKAGGTGEPPVPRHADDPAWAAAAPDLAGYVTGARVLFYLQPGDTLRDVAGRDVGAGPMLTSTGAGMRAAHEWRPGQALQARCLLGEYHPGVEPHPAPAPGCHCGLHAFHDVTTLLGRADPGTTGHFNVIALVRAWGALEVHTDGFRSEWVEPIAIVRGLDVGLAEAAAAHSGLPLVELGPPAAAFAAEHGSPVPVELRPSADDLEGLRRLVNPSGHVHPNCRTAPLPPVSMPPPAGAMTLLVPEDPASITMITIREGDLARIGVGDKSVQIGYDARRKLPVLKQAPLGWWIEPTFGAVTIGDSSGKKLLELGCVAR